MCITPAGSEGCVLGCTFQQQRPDTSQSVPSLWLDPQALGGTCRSPLGGCAGDTQARWLFLLPVPGSNPSVASFCASILLWRLAVQGGQDPAAMSAFRYLTYFSVPFQGQDGPPGNGTVGFPGAPVRILCCLETLRQLCLLV